jgi:hypothetical protein
MARSGRTVFVGRAPFLATLTGLAEQAAVGGAVV